MRDQDLIGRLNAIEGMAASDSKNLQRQALMLRTRIDAIERSLFASRFGILRAIFIQLFNPRALAMVIQANHSDQIRKMNEAIEAASKKGPAVKPAPISLAVSK